MSVSKLLSRIVAPDSVLSAEGDEDEIIKRLHEHTYGITSSPMTQFAAVVAALIHDGETMIVHGYLLKSTNSRLSHFVAVSIDSRQLIIRVFQIHNSSRKERV